MSAYTEGKKVIEPDARFKHVMAITLDPYLNYQEGIIRCITSREGNVQFRGYRDRSQLYKLKGKSLEEFTITDPLVIKNQEDIPFGVSSTRCLALVRCLVYHRIKPHAPPLVRVPVYSFEF